MSPHLSSTQNTTSQTRRLTSTSSRNENFSKYARPTPLPQSSPIVQRPPSPETHSSITVVHPTPPPPSTQKDASHARRPPTKLRRDLRPTRKLPRNRSTSHPLPSPHLPLPSAPSPPNPTTTNPPLTGSQPPNPRHITRHVHGLRDRLPNQHPRLQAEAQQRAAALLGLRVLPRHPGARERARHHPAAAGEGVYEPLQR